MGYRLLEHTADMGIEAWAETPEQLFAEAALGLAEVILGEQKVTPRQELALSAEADDRPGLLVAFLSEVRHLIEARGLLPAEIKVRRMTGTAVEARLRGEPFDRERHRLEREVKAVTYHQLQCEQTEEGSWKARVFLDL